MARKNTIELLYSDLAGMNGVAYTMHNALCRYVTMEARFTASSRSSGSHRNWTDLYRASNSRVRGVLWKALYVQDLYVQDGHIGNCILT
jgi:hypothetical protein